MKEELTGEAHVNHLQAIIAPPNILKMQAAEEK